MTYDSCELHACDTKYSNSNSLAVFAFAKEILFYSNNNPIESAAQKSDHSKSAVRMLTLISEKMSNHFWELILHSLKFNWIAKQTQFSHSRYSFNSILVFYLYLSTFLFNFLSCTVSAAITPAATPYEYEFSRSTSGLYASLPNHRFSSASHFSAPHSSLRFCFVSLSFVF